MSVSCSIDIKLVQYNEESRSNYDIPVMDMLKLLIDFGWRLNSNGGMCYLPVGDKDDFDWTSGRFDFVLLQQIVKQKEQLNEIVGINMWWKDTEIGGSFLFYTEHRIDGQISFILDANRPVLFDLNDRHKVTDVNWYLTRLLPAFKNTDMNIEYFSYEEHR